MIQYHVLHLFYANYNTNKTQEILILYGFFSISSKKLGFILLFVKENKAPIKKMDYWLFVLTDFSDLYKAFISTGTSSEGAKTE